METTKIINENPDSLEIGTPSKSGAIKVYGNFTETDSFKQKIDKAIQIRNYAKNKMEEI